MPGYGTVLFVAQKALRTLRNGKNALTFHDLMESQTTTGRALLSALARERVVKEITASGFLRRNALSAPSSIRTALEGLLKTDLVYRSEMGYLVYDRLLGEYLRRRSGGFPAPAR